MKLKEIKESYEEYNDEVGSVVTNLHTIRRMCDVLQKNLEADDNMAEWCQEKIAVTKSMIVTVTDYVLSQKEQGLEENASVGATASGSVATAIGGGVGNGFVNGGPGTIKRVTKKKKKNG